MADAAPAVAGWTADIEAVRAIAPEAVEGEGSQVKITREELLMLKRAAEEGAGLASEKRKREDNTFDSGRWEQMLEEHQDATMAKIEKQKKEIEQDGKWEKEGSGKQFKRVQQASVALEDVDTFLKKNVSAESKTRQALEAIILTGKKRISDVLRDIKLADRYGWRVVDLMKMDDLVDGDEDLDKRLKKAQRLLELESPKKGKGNGRGRGKGQYQQYGRGNGQYGQYQNQYQQNGYQYPQQGKGGPKGGCFNCGEAHFVSDCPMPNNGKGGQGKGKGKGWY
jgi:hypothetical protein